MKKVLLITLMMIVVGALLIGAIAGPASAKSMELKYATMNPTTAWIHDHSYIPWAEKVKAATKGCGAGCPHVHHLQGYSALSPGRHLPCSASYRGTSDLLMAT